MASSGASSSLASLMRLASWVICLIVAASFLVFVIDQTGSASTHQQNELSALPSPTSTPAGAEPTKPAKHESTVHKTLDEAANVFTSPFSAAVSGSHSQWVIRGVKTLLALLVFGLGLSYLARVIRVRV
jgi:hypothetical protein